MLTTQDFTMRGDFITLGQFLKACDIISSGGAVKDFLSQNTILVNDEVETRRGRKLRLGDSIQFADCVWQLVAAT